MPTWPVSLPVSPLADSFSEIVPDSVIRTQMDQGPAKLRQRTTAGIRQMDISFYLTSAQVVTLDSFYLIDLSGGALAFDYTHPRSGQTVSCRFRTPPQYTPTGNGYYLVRNELEILP